MVSAEIREQIVPASTLNFSCGDGGAIGSPSSSATTSLALIASVIWSIASERLLPVVMHPGRSGTIASYPAPSSIGVNKAV